MEKAIEDHESEILAKQEAAQKSTLVSVIVNIGLTITQVLAGIASGSQGLIADGIHSLTDLIAELLSSLLICIALKRLTMTIITVTNVMKRQPHCF